MKPVRVGRTEQRIHNGKVAREKFHRDASRGRHASIKDFAFIFAKGLPAVADLDKFIRSLVDEYRYGGRTEASGQAAIFDPAIRTYTEIPLGFLDDKELPPPDEMLPQSRDDLYVFCQRLIIASCDQDLVNKVAAGWPGAGSGQAKFDLHVDLLWRLSSERPELYRAIVFGRHKIAWQFLKKSGAPKRFTATAFCTMIVTMELIWCCHDIQMILARNSLASKNPFGDLVETDFTTLSPARIVTDTKPHRDLMFQLLAIYVTTKDKAKGKVDASEPEDPIYQILKNRIQDYARKRGINLRSQGRRIDKLVTKLRKEARHGRRADQIACDTPETTKSFAPIWFSGLSVVQASAVPILRYLQAEADLPKIIDFYVNPRSAWSPFNHCKIQDLAALPPFRKADLARGWNARARVLLEAYRRELLLDKDIPTNDPIRVAGAAPINKAVAFLEDAGERRIGDDHGAADDPRRTFYLLDIIPIARLMR